MKRFLWVMAFGVFLSPVALAADLSQYEDPSDLPANNQFKDPNELSLGGQTPNPANPGEMLDYVSPLEPVVPPVKYINQPAPSGLQERVDRVIQGIRVDVPPEYDHYGYEIRRYMAHIGGPEVLGNPERLKEELKNVKNAKIVFKYWQQQFLKEKKEIEEAFEKENSSSNVRTKFKFNQGITSAFMSECKAWLDKNESLLEFLVAIEGNYTYKDPDFTFERSEDRQAFIALYNAAYQARTYVNEYVPFSTMIY